MASRKTTLEKFVQADIFRAWGAHPSLRIWRANAGAAMLGEGDKKRLVRFGTPGQADISGVLRGGKRLEIEVKKADGDQSDEQKSFEAMIRRFGGIYVLARSVADVDVALAAEGISR